jgi:hypothetical protein
MPPDRIAVVRRANSGRTAYRTAIQLPRIAPNHVAAGFDSCCGLAPGLKLSTG